MSEYTKADAVRRITRVAHIPPMRSLAPVRLAPPVRRVAALLAVAGAVAAVLALAGGCVAGVGRPPPPPSPAESVVARAHLRAILSDHWTYVSQEWPAIGAWAGVRPSQLPDHTPDRWRAHSLFAQAALRALDEVYVEALSPDEYATWQALEWDMDLLARKAVYVDTDLTALAPARSPIAATVELLQEHPFTGEGDVERYVTLLHASVLLIDSLRAGLETRHERGIALPAPLLSRATGFVRSFIAPPAASPFRPQASRLAALDSTLAARLIADVEEAIRDRVNPSLERLANFLEGDYATSDRLGLGQYPGGVEHYRMLVRQYTTLDITPEEAHAIGLAEVRRIADLVQEAMREAGVSPSRDSLRTWLARAPEFGGSDGESFVEGVRARYDSVRARAPIPLGAVPTTVVVVDTMTAAEAQFAPLTRYHPPSVPNPVARYRVAYKRLRGGSGGGIAGLVYRDLLPGRHVQASWQRQNEQLPAFRRAGDYAGFADGWRLYALELADSLASADSPAQRLGSRLLLLHGACGLVIDTGINYFGWTRDQALEFLREYLPDSDEALEREFIVPAAEDPASLVAGTVGAREFRGLRRWAQEELEDAFDAADFHTTILLSGALPLPVVGTRLEWWLWERTAARADTAALK